MAGHIFDTNTLRNFALADALGVLVKVCASRRLVSRAVRSELRRGMHGYARANSDRIAHPPWSLYATRFHGLEAALGQLGFEDAGISDSGEHELQRRILAYLIDGDRLHAGEAESLAIAACSGFAFYTDEAAVHGVGATLWEEFGDALLAAGRRGPVPVHSSAWILLEAVKSSKLTMDRAEDIFDEMREVWERHPRKTLRALKRVKGYW